MKRISLVSVPLLLILFIPAEARIIFPCPIKHQVHRSSYKQSYISRNNYYTTSILEYGGIRILDRKFDYSPYAFKYGNNGMIGNNVKYTPYAFNYNNNGLVDYDTRYTPYVFSCNNPGLVSDSSWDYDGMSGSYSKSDILFNNIPAYSSAGNNKIENFAAYSEKVTAQKVAKRKADLKEQQAHLEKFEKERENDPFYAICRYLESKDINFRTNRSLRIDRKTISVDFILMDLNIIVKFWNSREISELANKEEYKKKCYDDYFESWKEYCLSSIGNDQQLFHIVSGDNEDTLIQLAECEGLNREDRIYALE